MYTLEGSIKVEDGKTYIWKERIQEIVGGYDLDRCEDVTYEEFQELKFGNEIAEIVLNELTEQSRWSTHHHCVFKLNGKYYSTCYSKGATEIQDESPYEYDNDWIEVDEVVPKEVTVTKYVKKG